MPTTTGSLDLKQILSNAQLPALPQSAIRLLELSQDPKNGPNEFAMPIEADPGLTGQVLRFVNSSYFGFSREISSVRLAITLVGIRTIKNFALWSAVFSLMPNPQCGPFDLKKLWQDSLRRGLFARAFARLLGLKDAEEAFAGSLLQDMAVPLLAKELAKEYGDMLERRDGGKVRLSDLEREHFGWTHAEAAAEMARGWNLPDEFVDLIGVHSDDIDTLIAQKAPPQQLAVALSALLPSASDETWTEREHFEQAYNACLPAGAPPVAELLAQVDHEYVEFAPVLRISTPARTLLEYYQDTAATPSE